MTRWRLRNCPFDSRYSSPLWLWMTVLIVTCAALSGSDYVDHSKLSAQLRQFADQHPQTVHLTPLAQSTGHRDLWLVELGVGSEDERKSRPALLLVAGIEGNDLTGSAVALAFVERLANSADQDPVVRDLLRQNTVYVLPRVNPDAAESYFLRPRQERAGTSTPTDNDHDGLTDEDGPEDLNGDGLITSMRVADPDGEYVPDPNEPRLLLRAEKARGDKAVWKLLTEGIDNDRDEQWNEDPPGGVNLNRNFPYRYAYFDHHSGLHPVSEIESRALADFFVRRPNIAIVFTYGMADNLIQTPKSEPGGKRPPTAIQEADEPYYKELGKVYREAVGLNKELTGASEPGTFSDWVYFHRGRFSLAAKAWSPWMQIEIDKARAGADRDGKTNRLDTAKDSNPKGTNQVSTPVPTQGPGETAKAVKDGPGGSADKRGESEREILKWFDTHAPEAYLPWKVFPHPDLTNRTVEIGGWAPFALTTAPTNTLDAICEKQIRFLTNLVGRLPRIALRQPKITPLGNGLFELKLQIENVGYLPTALAQGTLTREVLRTRVVLGMDERRILAGRKTTFLGPIAGSGGMEEVRYVIRSPGPCSIEVVSALGGSARQTIEFKEEQ